MLAREEERLGCFSGSSAAGGEHACALGGDIRLAALLSRIYPDHHATFIEGRSWLGARPEGRVIGNSEGGPVAHLGFLRRMLRIDEDQSLLIGDGGLVDVDPSLHGFGIGLRLLEETSTSFHNLSLPFGFLTCRPGVVRQSR